MDANQKYILEDLIDNGPIYYVEGSHYDLLYRIILQTLVDNAVIKLTQAKTSTLVELCDLDGMPKEYSEYIMFLMLLK